MKKLTKVQKILIGVGVGVVVIASIGGGVGAALSGSSDTTPKVQLPPAEQISTKELETRLERARQIFPKIGATSEKDLAKLKNIEEHLDKAKKGDSQAASYAAQEISRLEVTFKNAALHHIGIRDTNTRIDKRDEIKNIIDELQNIKSTEITTAGATKTAYDKLQELYSYFTNEENLLNFYIVQELRTAAIAKGKEVSTALTSGLAQFTDNEKIQISANFLNTEFKATGITALDTVTKGFAAGTTSLVPLTSTFSAVLKNFLTQAKAQMNAIIKDGYVAGKSPTKVALKGIETDTYYNNYFDIVNYINAAKGEITTMDKALTDDWADATKTTATLKNFAKVKNDTNRFSVTYSHVNVGGLSRYFDLINNLSPSISTRVTNAKEVVDGTDGAVPDIGLSDIDKDRIKEKIKEVETNWTESRRSEDPVAKSFGDDILYKARNEIEKYIFYRALVHFGLINEDQYRKNLINRTNIRSEIVNPPMDKVKNLLDNLIDRTTANYKKLVEIYDMFSSKKTRDPAFPFAGPITSYTKIIEKIKTKAGYDEVKALADSVQTTIDTGNAKLTTQ